jgi:Mn2+/Fe2+ NRAMP family transporter
MKKRTWDRVVMALVALLVALIAIEAFVFPYEHPVFPWHRLPGYSAGIGLIFALVMVLISKTLGAWFLQRPDDS